MEIERRNSTRIDRRRVSCGAAIGVSRSLAARDCGISGALERVWRTRSLGKEGIMRQITAWHRMLTVLAIGLLALAAPLVALAEGPIPTGH